MTRHDTGIAGEAYVAGRLEREGFRIITRNWRVRGGEIDIVAINDDVLVFVEVRVRRNGHVAAEETIDWRKLGRIMRAGERFIEQHPEYHEVVWRVDFVAITVSGNGTILRYNHFRNLTLE